MTTTQGRSQEPLNIEYSRTVQGSVEAGATVADHPTLTVQGGFSGPLTLLGPGPLLSANGVLNISGPSQSHGTVLASGVVNGVLVDLLAPDGRLAVAAGSIINVPSEDPHQLMADGQKHHLQGHGDRVDIDGSRMLGYVPRDARWVPLT